MGGVLWVAGKELALKRQAGCGLQTRYEWGPCSNTPRWYHSKPRIACASSVEINRSGTTPGPACASQLATKAYASMRRIPLLEGCLQVYTQGASFLDSYGLPGTFVFLNKHGIHIGIPVEVFKGQDHVLAGGNAP